MHREADSSPGGKGGEVPTEQIDDLMQQFVIVLGCEETPDGGLQFNPNLFKTNLLAYIMLRLANKSDGYTPSERTTHTVIASTTEINFLEAVTKFSARGNRQFDRGSLTARRLDGSGTVRVEFSTGGTAVYPTVDELSVEELAVIDEMIDRAREVFVPAEKAEF